jgi:NAD(P)-dependent dehydrogenase (short-subunit alcohol dehydrogenase family)
VSARAAVKPTSPPRGGLRLSGRVALVTGASRGIGRGVAEALAAEGAGVALAARSAADLEAVARGVSDAGGRAEPFVCDLADERAVAAAVESVFGRFRRIDVLVNNAGIGVRGKVEELAVADWDRMFAVNLRGVFLMTRAVVPHMKRQGGGHIVNIASVAGLVGNPNLSGYNATKFGLMGFSEALLHELRHDRIKVTAVCPGSTDTEFSGDATRAGKPNYLTVTDVAHAVVEVVATAPNALISQVHVRPLLPPSRG